VSNRLFFIHMVD